MNSDSFAARVPLFLPSDEEVQPDQMMHIEQLDQQTITFPLSYTLLDALNFMSVKDGSTKHINAILDEVVKSPSYFFPEIPLVFENRPLDGILQFVPDDNQEHVLNWRAIILQLHLSLLSVLNFKDISKVKKFVAFHSSSEEFHDVIPEITTSSRVSATMTSKSLYTTGSITMRSQSKCIASFNDKTVGSFQSFDNVQYDIAPKINREENSNVNQKDIANMNLDINSLFDLQILCSFESPLFRNLILAISARGLLDRAFGNMILREFSQQFDEASINVSRTPIDPSPLFDSFLATLSRSLLSTEMENSLKDEILKDNINSVLSKIDSYYPFDNIVPHSRDFFESILGPLCYHEDKHIAHQAEKLYTCLINGHGWELHTTEITTADSPFDFTASNDHVIVVSAPLNNGSAYVVLNGNTFQPPYSGYYDFCYAKTSSTGELEFDQNMPCGRYIVLPAGARKEIIHELPAFDEKGPIKFDALTAKLEELSNSGVTAVHVSGAIERNLCHDLTSVTDHSVISIECGGVDSFKKFCTQAKTLGLRVLIDFTPLVCIRNSSKKYSPFTTLTLDDFGRLVTADVPDSDMLLLNYRSLKLWDLFANELIALCEQCDISGFYFGNVTQWDTVLARDLKELRRLDPDRTLHYGLQNLMDGTIVSVKKKAPKCGLTQRDFSYSPFMAKLMRKLWSKVHDAFVWMQCTPEQEPFVINSGIIPANYAFRTVMQKTIEYSIHCDNVDYVNANEEMIKFYDERNKRNPEGSFCIAPFGALMDGPYNIPMEGLQLALDLLFYLTDVPLLSGCLDTAMFYVNSYGTEKKETEEILVEADEDDDDEGLILVEEEQDIPKLDEKTAASIKTGSATFQKTQQASSSSTLQTPSAVKEEEKPKKKVKRFKKVKKVVVRGYKWNPPTQKVVSLLKNRAGTRTKADWALGGDVHILPVSYDSHPMRAILAVARVCQKSKKCALICTSFYMYPLIYEVGVLTLPLLENIPDDTVVEVKPLIGASGQPSYYAVNEVTQNSSSLFLELDRFATSLYEIDIISSPTPPNIKRVLNEHIYTRLERAIHYSSNTILANNKIFNSILDAIENEPTDEELDALIASLPSQENVMTVFREALVFATRNHKVNKLLVPFNSEEEMMVREARAMKLIKRIAASKLEFISHFGREVLIENDLGSIMFVAPELGPFSKVGGLSTMVWELAKELVQLGLNIHCVSPYYNVNPKGETGYLSQYGIEYKQTIDVYAPDQIKIGIHYGVVDGVKLWFLHHYSFFSVPYQTGSSSFRLQLLVVMAKASLEMCCQVRVIPKLIISNDWMTGLVPAIAKKQFGAVFQNTLFMHIFHNLGVGYAGKIWPGDTGALYYIHQLPDEIIVDHFDHSFDPSMCALLTCDQWATVSKRYRDELLESSPYSWALRRFPNPFAYSNGIRFQERQSALTKLKMSHDDAKRFVQQKYFGYVDDNKCLFVFVGRIVEQKGVHLIIDCFENLQNQFNGCFQFILGGQAAPDDRSYGLPCTQRMWDLKQRFPGNFWADPSQFFSDGLLACHAADYTLIPSIFEPSGIVQQEAFASGCPVIAFRTGGLADTVFEYDKEKKTGNGMLFWSHQHHDYMMAIQRAFDVFRDKPNYWKLRENAYYSVLTTEKVAVQWSREFARMFLKIFDKAAEEEVVTVADKDEKKEVKKIEKKK